MRRATKKQREKFLEVYAKSGNITVAAREAGVVRATHYKWMEDPDYAQAFEEASETASDLLIEEARRRAQDGWDEPVFYQGEQCWVKDWNPESEQFEVTRTPLAVRKYDSVLLMFLIKARRPEYRDAWKGEIQHSGTVSRGAPDFSRLSDEQLEQLRVISHTIHNGHAVNGVAADDEPDGD